MVARVSRRSRAGSGSLLISFILEDSNCELLRADRVVDVGFFRLTGFAAALARDLAAGRERETVRFFGADFETAARFLPLRFLSADLLAIVLSDPGMPPLPELHPMHSH